MNNKKRLVRALEIYEATGKPPSEHFRDQENNPVDTLDLFTILLNWERSILTQRIAQRTQEMLDNGWIDEVETLLKEQKDKEISFPALNSIGYRQIQAYLNGDMTHDEMKEEIMIRTRQFSRRQVQWFKKEKIDLIVEMGNLDQQRLPEILHCIFMASA